MNTKLLATIMIVVIVVAGAAAAIVISGDDDEKKDYKIDTKLEIYGNADGDDDIDSEPKVCRVQ